MTNEECHILQVDAAMEQMYKYIEENNVSNE